MALKQAQEPGGSEYSHGRGIINPVFVDGSMKPAAAGALGDDVPWYMERMLDAQQQRYGNQDDPTGGRDPYGTHVTPVRTGVDGKRAEGKGGPLGGETLEERGGFALVREASPNLNEGYRDPTVIRRDNNDPWRTDADREKFDPDRRGWEGGNYDEEVNAQTVAGNPDNMRTKLSAVKAAADYGDDAVGADGTANVAGNHALPLDVQKRQVQPQAPRKIGRVPSNGDQRMYMGKKVRDLGEVEPGYYDE